MTLNLPWTPKPQGLLLTAVMLSCLPCMQLYNHRGECTAPCFPRPISSPGSSTHKGFITLPWPCWSCTSVALLATFQCPVHARSTNHTLSSSSRVSIVYWLENIFFLSRTSPSHWNSLLLNCLQTGKKKNPSTSFIKWLTYSSLSDTRSTSAVHEQCGQLLNRYQMYSQWEIAQYFAFPTSNIW